MPEKPFAAMLSYAIRKAAPSSPPTARRQALLSPQQTAAPSKRRLAPVPVWPQSVAPARSCVLPPALRLVWAQWTARAAYSALGAGVPPAPVPRAGLARACGPAVGVRRGLPRPVASAERLRPAQAIPVASRQSQVAAVWYLDVTARPMGLAPRLASAVRSKARSARVRPDPSDRCLTFGESWGGTVGTMPPPAVPRSSPPRGRALGVVVPVLTAEWPAGTSSRQTVRAAVRPPSPDRELPFDLPTGLPPAQASQTASGRVCELAVEMRVGKLAAVDNRLRSRSAMERQSGQDRRAALVARSRAHPEVRAAWRPSTDRAPRRCQASCFPRRRGSFWHEPEPARFFWRLAV